MRNIDLRLKLPGDAFVLRKFLAIVKGDRQCVRTVGLQQLNDGLLRSCRSALFNFL